MFVSRYRLDNDVVWLQPSVIANLNTGFNTLIKLKQIFENLQSITNKLIWKLLILKIL